MHNFMAADLVRQRQLKAQADAEARLGHVTGRPDEAARAARHLWMWRYLRRESS